MNFSYIAELMTHYGQQGGPERGRAGPHASKDGKERDFV